MEYGYLDKEVKELVAERDRLVAENAELREDLVVVGGAFSHANATLDRLREKIPEDCFDWDKYSFKDRSDMLLHISSVLYSNEVVNNDEQVRASGLNRG